MKKSNLRSLLSIVLASSALVFNTACNESTKGSGGGPGGTVQGPGQAGIGNNASQNSNSNFTPSNAVIPLSPLSPLDTVTVEPDPDTTPNNQQTTLNILKNLLAIPSAYATTQNQIPAPPNKAVIHKASALLALVYSLTTQQEAAHYQAKWSEYLSTNQNNISINSIPAVFSRNITLPLSGGTSTAIVTINLGRLILANYLGSAIFFDKSGNFFYGDSIFTQFNGGNVGYTALWLTATKFVAVKFGSTTPYVFTLNATTQTISATAPYGANLLASITGETGFKFFHVDSVTKNKFNNIASGLDPNNTCGINNNIPSGFHILKELLGINNAYAVPMAPPQTPPVWPPSNTVNYCLTKADLNAINSTDYVGVALTNSSGIVTRFYAFHRTTGSLRNIRLQDAATRTLFSNQGLYGGLQF